MIYEISINWLNFISSVVGERRQWRRPGCCSLPPWRPMLQAHQRARQRRQAGAAALRRPLLPPGGHHGPAPRRGKRQHQRAGQLDAPALRCEVREAAPEAI